MKQNETKRITWKIEIDEWMNWNKMNWLEIKRNKTKENEMQQNGIEWMNQSLCEATNESMNELLSYFFVFLYPFPSPSLLLDVPCLPWQRSHHTLVKTLKKISLQTCLNMSKIDSTVQTCPRFARETIVSNVSSNIPKKSGH